MRLNKLWTSFIPFLFLAMGATACGGSGGETSEETAEESGNETGIEDPTDPWSVIAPELMGGIPGDACPQGYKDALPEGINEEFLTGGQSRRLMVVTPDEETHPGPRPLLLSFNGTGGTAEGAFESYALQNFVDRGFVVASLSSNANGTVWPSWDSMHATQEDPDKNPDLAFFNDALACVAAHRSVDTHRIYILGHSAGGIMVNYLLQHRSDVLAGGIAASSILSLTSPIPPIGLEPMAVIVTWGGDNDIWGGESESDIAVPEINFVAEAALTSQKYEKEENVNQIWCKGNDLGHDYPDGINDYMIDFLLAHPKGYADNPHWSFSQTEEGADALCGEDAVVYEGIVDILCPGDGFCTTYCSFIADCAGENGTVAPAIGPQLIALGFSGDYFEECGGCIEVCEADLATDQPGDVAVKQCVKDIVAAEAEAVATNAAEGQCAQGIEGAFPFIYGMDACCADALDSALCTRLCTTILENSAAAGFFVSCEAWAPEEEEEGGEETD
jgi:predicted esterase